MKNSLQFTAMLIFVLFLFSCENELISEPATFSSSEATTTVVKDQNKGRLGDKVNELECWEYPSWSVSDWLAYDFDFGSCANKLDEMQLAGDILSNLYTEEILGYCWDGPEGCARVTETIPGSVSVDIDGSGEFDGNIVFGKILTAAKSLYRTWQIQKGLGPNGEIAFICNTASITNISLGCSNTPNSTITVTFDLFLRGQPKFRCDACEEPSAEVGPVITGPGDCPEPPC